MQKGKDANLPPAPIELVYLRYRQQFNLTWREFCETPWEVVLRDLEMFDIEAKVLKSKMKSK